MTRVPFNRADLSGKEEDYLKEVLVSRQVSGNGPFTKRCSQFFETAFDIPKAFLTNSCTDALEMCALLLELGPGDEVILPSFTFVSTANAFALRGVDLVFCDSSPNHPNLDLDGVEALITPRTRAVVVVHYGGVACDMDRLSELTAKHGIKVVEDAAHAIDSYYKGRPLGSIGELGAFSFHETKNVTSGEGGLLAVNDPALAGRAEILWEKGTNRSQFFRGEVDKYHWVDLGSSFLGSELAAALLWAQLQRLPDIQNSRLWAWNSYREALAPHFQRGVLAALEIPPFATNNAHLFAVVCRSLEERTALLNFMKARDVHGAFHYQPLHASPYFAPKYRGAELPNSLRFGDCLVRLPLFAGMTEQELSLSISAVTGFLEGLE